MKKILIIGSGGAGKSTLASLLHKITGLPLLNLDRYYWKPNWKETPTHEWEETIKSLCKTSEWIMDGNYGGTLDYRLSVADTIIFIYLPRFYCIFGALKRRFLKNRIDDIPGCIEKFDLNFLKWIWNYNTTHAPGILRKLEIIENKSIYIITNRKQLKCLVDNIKYK